MKMLGTVILLVFLAGCSIPLAPAGTIQAEVSHFETAVLPGDTLQVEIATDARALEVSLTLPEGVSALERIEGAVLVLTLRISEDAEPGARLVTVELADGARYALVTLGLDVQALGAEDCSAPSACDQRALRA